ncbi:MAG: hypothetical protein KIG62_10555 [Oscillospiraceae bacterium]|nr:hypothetical protein [Oscillospiraceae bacterium]
MKIVKAFASFLAAAAVASAAAVNAFADYTYDLSNRSLASIQNAKEKSVSQNEAHFTVKLPTNVTLRCTLFNELADLTYWSYDNVNVTAEIRLETEGVETVGYIAGMGDGWQWVAPAEQTPLVYNEWVTVSVSGLYLYESWLDAGSDCAPGYLVIDVRNAEGQPAVDNVKFTVRNVKVSGPAVSPYAAAVPEETTPAATTTEPTTVSEPAEEPTSEPEDTQNTENTSDTSTTEETGATENSEATEETTTSAATTTSATPAENSEISPAQSSIGTAAPVNAKDDGTVAQREENRADIGVGIIVLAIGIVVVLIVAAVGFFIFKKKK